MLQVFASDPSEYDIDDPDDLKFELGQYIKQHPDLAKCFKAYVRSEIEEFYDAYKKLVPDQS